MRFDDTLETVLAADLTTPYGAQSAWRQLVDLIGRRRAEPTARAMATLRSIRTRVPLDVRIASARGLEHASPPAALVWLFAHDELQVVLPVLRTARLGSAEWVQLLPEFGPAARQVLRNRRDLSPIVQRALESFGPVDFVLPDDSEPQPALARKGTDLRRLMEEAQAVLARMAGQQSPLPPRIADDSDAASDRTMEAVPAADVPEDEEDLSFIGLAGTASVLPSASGSPGEERPDADETHGSERAGERSAPVAERRPDAEPSSEATGGVGEGPFEIAEVVARIDAFWRSREEGAPPPPAPAPLSDRFRFETDAQGVIRWVDGISRTPIIGLNLDLQGPDEGSGVDGVAAGAFRGRSSFSSARMWIDGESDAAGDWLISAVPVFDSANGRFAGFRGTARRPRADERAEGRRSAPIVPAADSLRQLVHELRTPTNAIAGFSEMIETQMLGPVAEPYRERAHDIREQARELLGAIDDLDLAARIDSAALALIPASVPLRPLLSGIADDLAELAALRGCMIALPEDDLSILGDRRAVERLLSRLMATLVSASGAGERIGVRTALDEDMISIAIERPRALADYPGDSVLGIDDEREDATLLGTGFALRLARNLARELGGGLSIGPDSLTLRLPAAVNAKMGQAHRS